MRKTVRVRKAIRNNAGLIALVVSMLFMRTAIADWSYVPSGSMEPTLYGGDWVLVSKRHYGPSIPFTSFRLLSTGVPERGDVITFYPPHEDVLYVKRVIGIPGDTVMVRGRDVYLNGTKLSSSEVRAAEGVRVGREIVGGVSHAVQYSDGRSLPLMRDALVVPPGKYFVLGDHRNSSADSRYWGYVDEERIVGKVTHIAVSFSRKRPLSARLAIPIT